MLPNSQALWLSIIEGVLIGVPILIVGYYLKSRGSDTPKSVRLALADLAKNLTSCIHSINWLCWSVQHSPAAIRGNIKSYNTEMHKQLSDLMASRVILAAQDTSKYNLLAPLMAKVLALDVKVGKVVAGCLSLHPLQEAAAQKELINCHGEAVELEQELLKMVSDLVKVTF
ncbi:hypothetical protein GFS24_04620 [Chitinophaga sp. SYP-B3965]|uniref:hypothetical protein n=1 Tax=Chitinophaga sp. SYP-B3965 TaxID=2663120 RepID=UPI0012999778|nr:hypothetical protein [Chitinophaga sp. SYP-B3965]MRG44383.1 hypothetical protein [Chitinophaga sp. SYP-B3965]